MRAFAIAILVLLLATLAPMPTASAACSTKYVNGGAVRVYATTGDETSCTDLTVQRCQPRFDPFTGTMYWVCPASVSTPPVPDAPVVCEGQYVGGVPVKVYVGVGTDPDCVGVTVYRCTYYYDFPSGQLLMNCNQAVSLP